MTNILKFLLYLYCGLYLISHFILLLFVVVVLYCGAPVACATERGAVWVYTCDTGLIII